MFVLKQEQENSNGFTFSKYFRDFFKLLRKFPICHVTVLKDENCGERTLQQKCEHCSTGDERLLIIESHMLEVKNLIALADLRSNIVPVFCYVLEL